MNSLQIEYFLAVADHNSFTKAAGKFYITQPAISRAIAALESELGFSLFERTARNIALTPAGRLFYDAFIQAHLLLSEAAQKAQAMTRTTVGHVRLGILAGLDISSLLPVLIENFKVLYPNITISMNYYDFMELRKSLESGQVDAIMTILDSVHHMPNASVQTLITSHRILLYSPQYSPQLSDPPAPEDFRDDVFLTVADDSVRSEDLVYQYCRPYGFTPCVRMVKNYESQISGVLNGLGVAIVDGWSREKTNQAFGCLHLNTANQIVLAFLKLSHNPILPLVVSELTLLAGQGADAS